VLTLLWQDKKRELDAKALKNSLNPHKRTTKGKKMSMNQRAVFASEKFKVRVAARALPFFVSLTLLSFSGCAIHGHGTRWDRRD
jgi:hypothetical protein